jgi:hypothetical protein
MSNVIAFPGTDPTANLPAPQPWPDYDLKRRNPRNPLRQHFVLVGTAIVEANRLNPRDPAQSLQDVRDGAEAARILAIELDRAAERMANPAPASVRALSGVELAMAYDAASPEAKRLICAEIERYLATRNDGEGRR